MIVCPTCGGTSFGVWDAFDQAMCLNCQTVLFDFSLIEAVDKLVNGESGQKQDGEQE